MTLFQLNVVLPKHILSAKDFEAEIKKAAKKSIQGARRDIVSSIATWDHKPKIVDIEETTAEHYLIATGTDDKIFGYVDEGTRPHVITAKRSKYLRWNTGYKAKTRVGIIGSQPGGASGPPAYAESVNHPGFPGRKFAETIAKRRQKTFEQEISHGIAILARKQS